MPRTTLAAIAYEAGVSVPTVSKVLNGRGDVGADTRLRIEELLHDHDYLRRSAATLRTAGQAALIEVVCDALDNPWAAAILAGVESVTRAAGMGMVVTSAAGPQGSKRPPTSWLEQMRAHGSSGALLVLAEFTARQRKELDRLKTPFVVIDPIGQPDPSVASVGATNWSGGIAATEHLLALGHRKIATVTGPLGLPCSQARLDGYRTAMARAGASVDPRWVRHGNFLHEQGYTETTALLQLDDRPTGIVFGSDHMALGAYHALLDRGLRIPEDMSVVGFDDLPEVRWSVPPLTTIRQPLTEMAIHATQMLLRYIAGEQDGVKRVELAATLVERASTGRPPTIPG